MNTKLGAKIRLLRTLKGYSQEAMAESLKLSVTGYGKVERDETDVTVLRLSQIAEVLGLKGEDIMRMDDPVSFYSNGSLEAGNHVKSVTSVEEALSVCRTLYESRINRLEDEVIELRKIILSAIKPSTANKKTY